MELSEESSVESSVELSSLASNPLLVVAFISFGRFVCIEGGGLREELRESRFGEGRMGLAFSSTVFCIDNVKSCRLALN